MPSALSFLASPRIALRSFKRYARLANDMTEVKQKLLNSKHSRFQTHNAQKPCERPMLIAGRVYAAVS